MDYKEKENFYKIRKTILEMIEDRGILIPEVEKLTFEQFCIKYSSNKLDIFINDTIKNKKIYIYYHNDTKSFGKSDFTSIVKKITTEYSDQNINLLLILKEKENSAISKELNKDIYKNVEIFLRKNLLFNITHHTFVPKHILLTEEEAVIIETKYNTTRSKLPNINKDDPIVKYYSMKSGQVCKILRNSPEVGETVYYRAVK